MTSLHPRALLRKVMDVASLATTPLTPSHYVELVSKLRATHTRYARVEHVHDETPDARTLTLRPGARWRRHRAGQFVPIGAEIDGRVVTRTYSISSPPERADGCIAITVKAVPGGRMSRHLVRGVAPGEYVTLGDAAGDFVLPDDVAGRRLLFVTGGSGLTPVMSMLRSLAARAAFPDVVHVHYAPRTRDVLFGDELARIAAATPSYRLVLQTTRPDAGAGAPRLDRDELERLVPDHRAREAWACGPEPLVAVAESAYASAGREAQLHVERFRPKRAPRAAAGGGGRVRFERSRVEVEAPDDTPLLEVAERAGVAAPHGCRMGICHSCSTKLLGGCVRDLRTGERTREPGARVQLCVSSADGDLELAL